MAEILIIGAGPTGLVLASELLRRGISVRIIDKAKGPSVHSKALGIQIRTLELLDKMGIIEEFLSKGMKAYGLCLHHAKETFLLSIDSIESRYPFILLLPQSETEQILHEHLVKLGGKVEWNTEFIALRGNEAILKTPSTEEFFSPSWIVGCDGAHSALRHAMGIPFKGARYSELFLIVDLRAQTSIPRQQAHAFLNNSGATLIVPLPSENSYRVIFPNYQENENLTNVDASFLEQFLKKRNIIMNHLELDWVSSFRIHRRMVNAFRKKNLFLAGDAAHIHSPAGGQGMNTSIQDAINLAWKLDLVIQGVVDPALLDTYHQERAPVAKRVLIGTSIFTRALLFFQRIKLLSFYYKLAKTLFSQDFIHRKIIHSLSELTVNYRKSSLSYGHSRDLLWEGPKSGDRAPDCILQEGKWFSEYLRTPLHVALFFEESSFRTKLKEKYGKWIEIIVIKDAQLRKNMPPNLILCISSDPTAISVTEVAIFKTRRFLLTSKLN